MVHMQCIHNSIAQLGSLKHEPEIISLSSVVCGYYL